MILLSTPYWAPDAVGTWKMNRARSTFSGELRPKSLTVRIEPHARGEVFTLDRIGEDGRDTTSSTILYFDGQPRNFQEPQCSGTQSSRRVNSRSVEILRNCASGAWTRFVGRLAAQQRELILEITEQQPDGHRFKQRLVLEKHSEGGSDEIEQRICLASGGASCFGGEMVPTRDARHATDRQEN